MSDMLSSHYDCISKSWKSFIDILELVGTAVLENGRQVRTTGSAVHQVHSIMCCPFC